tara:strand:+ start:104 stop:706 length:603 start_codon:yes stop_codon:yes gene_type:complete
MQKDKLLSGLVLAILSFNNLMFSQIHVGMDVSGSFDISYPSELDLDSEDYDSDNGLVIGYDYVIQKQDQINLGVGVEYMMLRGVDEFSEGKGAFHSIYGFGKYLVDNKIYGLGRLGYSIHTGDDDYTDTDGVGKIELEGGMMYSLGGGYSLTPNINLEASYSSHAGGFEYSGSEITEYYGSSLDYKLKYTRFNIGIIYTP